MKENKQKKTDSEGVSEAQPNFTHKANGCWKNPENGCWMMFEVPVDPVSKCTGKLTFKALDADRMLSLDQFKIYITEKQEIFNY